MCGIVTTSSDDRLIAFGTQLVQLHDRLRQEIAAIRTSLDAGISPELHTHCLTFCAAVTTHHTSEDDGAFPVLAREHPELAPVLDELRRDHQDVANLMRSLENVLAEVGPGADAATVTRVQQQVDGLAAVLESHLSFEERKIVAALDDLVPDAADMPALRRAVTISG